MNNTDPIPKTPPTSLAGDYARLREEGLRHIERLSSDLWTDYNVHDPGITLLELLCYALTDLEYRTSWNVKDLLADTSAPSPSSGRQFHTPREILTSEPVTLIDFRKILIDIEGVRNAWLDPLEETLPELYVDRGKGEWETEGKKGNRRLNLQGLYEVILELEKDEKTGDLNDYFYEMALYSDPEEGEENEKLMARLPDWSEWHNEGLRAAEMETPAVRGIDPADEEGRFTWRAAIEIEAGGRIFERTAELEATDKDIPVGELKRRLDEESVMERYGRKLRAALGIGWKAFERLQTSRSLCEDFESFRALDVEKIGVCADIEVESGAELEKVLAEIYYRIGRHLAPSVNFYSLEEMVEKGVPASEIFEGPALNHGFIISEELEQADINREIHVSDLLQIMMDVEGVRTVDNLMLNSSYRGESVSSNIRWEHRVKEGRVPRLSIKRSDIELLKEKLPYGRSRKKVERYLEDFRSLERRRKLSPDAEYDFAVPEGSDRRVADYTSVQADLPLNYGVGEAGIPGRGTEKRRAQSRQLRAYLTFYDQLLANYLAQLANLKNLYSFSDEPDRTYFFQALFEKPGGTETAWDDVRFDPEASPGIEQVVGDPVSFLERMDRVAEDDRTFEDRRNRFLDHLLARFGESFTDYVMLMYSREEGPRTARELIGDKTDFLRDYPQLSSERGAAFNYKGEVWDTENVSGFEKRVCRLLGIQTFGRYSLQCPDPEEFFELYEDRGGDWRFRLTKGESLLMRSEGYPGREECREGKEAVKKAGRDPDNYERRETSDGRFYFVLKGENGEIIARGTAREEPEMRDKQIAGALALLRRECEKEGFHLVEHILLRPARSGGPKLPVCALEEGRGCPGYTDPYSFRVSLVIPYWPERFDNMAFRRFMEKTIRREAPAHIHVKICWVDHEDLAAFEKAYRDWLEAKSADRPEPGALEEKLEKLIGVMSEMRSVYPVATLHDFREDRDDNPMLLDNTVLGTFSPE